MSSIDMIRTCATASPVAHPLAAAAAAIPGAQPCSTIYTTPAAEAWHRCSGLGWWQGARRRGFGWRRAAARATNVADTGPLGRAASSCGTLGVAALPAEPWVPCCALATWAAWEARVPSCRLRCWNSPLGRRNSPLGRRRSPLGRRLGRTLGRRWWPRSPQVVLPLI